MRNYSYRKPVKSFVIGARGTALYEPGTNTHLNSAGGTIVLAEKQLGVFAETGPLAMKSLLAADTTVKANQLAIYQGVNPLTTYTGPLPVRPYEKTQTINFDRNVTVTKRPYTKGSMSVYAIKTITALPLATYSINIAFRGRHAQVIGSHQEALSISPQFITPNYSAAQLLTTAPVSEIINNMVIETNYNSSAINNVSYRQGNWPVVALAIDTTAGSGVALSAITAGTKLNVLTDTVGSKGFILNQEMVDSLKAAATAAGIALTSTVIVANRTTPVLANAMLIMGLDRQAVTKDYEWMKRTRLELGLISGFNLATTYSVQTSFAKEEQGSAAALYNEYLFTQGQRKYNLLDVTDPVVNYPNIFSDATETYNVFVIQHENQYMVDHTNVQATPLFEYICIETPVKGVEAVAGLTTTMETRLNTLLASAGYSAVE